MIKDKGALKSELEDLKLRIETKIRKITLTHQKLPFERLSKGRKLKELVIMTLDALNKGDDLKVNEYIRELREREIKISDYGT
jgi:hypothetical protein